VARAGPLGQPAALQEGIDQTLHDVRAHLGVHESDKRHCGTEGIPEAIVGKESARKHLAVIRTVVNNISGAVSLVEHPGEEHGAVEG